MDGNGFKNLMSPENLRKQIDALRRIVGNIQRRAVGNIQRRAVGNIQLVVYGEPEHTPVLAPNGQPLTLDYDKPIGPQFFDQMHSDRKPDITGDHLERFLAVKEAIQAYGNGNLETGLRWALEDLKTWILNSNKTAYFERELIDPLTDFFDEHSIYDGNTHE
jgi:hypothetical protein